MHIKDMAMAQEDPSEESDIPFRKEYIKYMSILSRQLASSIKTDFDPYLLSSDINTTLWGQPEIFKQCYDF